jgi:hypothetical protein
MAQPAAIFTNDADLETMVHVHEIAKDGTILTIDIYARNPCNARQALADPRAAIDDLPEE